MTTPVHPRIAELVGHTRVAIVVRGSAIVNVVGEIYGEDTVRFIRDNYGKYFKSTAFMTLYAFMREVDRMLADLNIPPAHQFMADVMDALPSNAIVEVY